MLIPILLALVGLQGFSALTAAKDSWEDTRLENAGSGKAALHAGLAFLKTFGPAGLIGGAIAAWFYWPHG